MSRLFAPIRRYSKCQLPLQIEHVGKQETDKVLNFLRPYFFRDEPINKSINLIETESSIRALENFCRRIILNGIALKLEDDGKIVAVSLCSLRERGKTMNVSEECTDPKFQKVLRLFEFFDKKVDIFNNFPHVDLYQYGELVSVDRDYRQLGLFKLLTLKNVELGKKIGSKMLGALATNTYSKYGSLAVGMEEVCSVKYSDYKENGQVVFEPDFPHVSATYVRLFLNGDEDQRGKIRK